MNHGSEIPAYGLWSLVLIESAVFIFFAFSFFKPRTKRDWRTFGGFSAFVGSMVASSVTKSSKSPLSHACTKRSTTSA